MLDLKELLYPLVMGMIWTWNTVASAVLTLIGPRLRRFVRMQMKLGGILINTKENKPGDIRVLNEDFYHRLGIDQLLGLGEMYMEGWWECDHLDVMFTRGILNGLFNVMTYPWHRFFYYLQFQVFNLQTAARSWEVAEKHYNLEYLSV
ncbi:unnamed protein product [Allacma fusca]|uniref:Cyclopropane-fatty-acyl-phospholipid synthase n=1 Tax=Allacma fusca TaxID=39272 RepID=A0A8J2PW13_9HEXA|nr:unnamed protein product [Allacma fusca]